MGLGLRFTPLDSAGLYFPGGKASYPSTLIMLAVPAQVAGVKRIVVCSPPSKYGKTDLVLAACHELGLTDVFRAGGAAAIAALAFGTQTIPAVDKIVGPGNRYVQLAKRALAGCVGIDGFLGPSEILVLADETGRRRVHRRRPDRPGRARPGQLLPADDQRRRSPRDVDARDRRSRRRSLEPLASARAGAGATAARSSSARRWTS